MGPSACKCSGGSRCCTAAALLARDVAGGLTAAVVLLAIEGSYGLIAFARLGPE